MDDDSSDDEFVSVFFSEKSKSIVIIRSDYGFKEVPFDQIPKDEPLEVDIRCKYLPFDISNFKNIKNLNVNTGNIFVIDEKFPKEVDDLWFNDTHLVR